MREREVKVFGPSLKGYIKKYLVLIFLSILIPNFSKKIGGLVVLITIFYFFFTLIQKFNIKYIITTERVLRREVLRKRTHGVKVSQIVGVLVRQDFLGKRLNFGDVVVESPKIFVFKSISNPIEVRNMIHRLMKSEIKQ